MGKIHQELVDSTTPREPYVLLFPIPFQGPVNCFLKLAELLCRSGIHVTFLNTNHIHGPLLRHTQVLSRFSGYPNFQFETIPDGLEHENPASRDQFREVINAIDVVTKPLFREMIVSGSLIVDGVLSFAAEVAIETSTPVLSFETISPCCLWTSYFNLHTLIEAGHLPFKGVISDEVILNGRFVGEVWKTGIDIKDTCDRFIVEKAVRDIMDVKRNVFTRTTNIWANLAKESIGETGSSSISLGRLIDDIRGMSSTMN